MHASDQNALQDMGIGFAMPPHTCHKTSILFYLFCVLGTVFCECLVRAVCIAGLQLWHAARVKYKISL